MKRAKGFTLIELVIASMIIMILGTTIILALLVFVNSYVQSNDYVVAREEMEAVFQLIGRETTNIALGMPNNILGNGDFSNAFRGRNSEASGPIMWRMGADAQAWGGPVTLRLVQRGAAAGYDNPNLYSRETARYGGTDVFVGNELFYAFGVPVTVRGPDGKIRPLKVGNQQNGEFSNGLENSRVFEFLQEGGLQALINFRHDGQAAGILPGNGTQTNPRSWVLFSSLHVPMLVEGWRPGDGTGDVGNPNVFSPSGSITLTMAPGSVVPFYSMLNGFEEVLIIKVCRIFVNSDRQLVQMFFGGDHEGTAFDATSQVKVLAENVSNVCFMFDPAGRLLTMYLAILGGSTTPPGGGAENRLHSVPWPTVTGNGAGNINNIIKLPDEDLKRTIVTGSRTWRIRN